MAGIGDEAVTADSKSKATSDALVLRSLNDVN